MVQSTQMEVYANIPYRIIQSVNDREDQFWEDHFQSRSFLWDIVEFCRCDNFYDNNCSFYHILMQTLMSNYNDCEIIKLNELKRYIKINYSKYSYV
jgi:hypothetical protein